jgi:hypothetical protein
MVNFRAVCGCCTRADIVREHLEDTLRICDVSAMGLYTTCSILRPRLHEIGTKSNRNENWNCQHVYMRPVRKSQNNLFPLSCMQAIFFFRWLLLACVVPMSRLQPRPVWNVFVFTFIPVWIHAGLKSVGSVQHAGIRNDLRPSELFSSQSHVNIYYK